MAQLVDGGEETTQYNRLQSSFSAEMSFWEKMLTVNANFTFMKGNEDYNWFKNKYVIGYGPNDIRELGDSKAYKSTTNDYYSVLELFATFNKAFDKHYVTGILGFNQEYNRWNWYKAEREGIISTSPVHRTVVGRPVRQRAICRLGHPRPVFPCQLHLR